MDDSTLRVVLQIVAVVSGGGILEFFRRLFSRRTELREMDTRSDAAALDSANAYIKTLQDGDKTTRGELDSMKADLRRERMESEGRTQALQDALDTAYREMGRLRAELSRVRSDLTIAESRIAELTRHAGI